ncbi:hypothetical protein TH63_07910 [Rufibacter radiotolerans]|uniref:Uncharacterized protein n=1 Tax=Rufibacter radiotolerans TaxID=1379910 RepID=A0A0H4W5C2_9BACT|nr:hypothetical protein TH63_07910 [Rufibacter radiotolerans]
MLGEPLPTQDALAGEEKPPHIVQISEGLRLATSYGQFINMKKILLLTLPILFTIPAFCQIEADSIFIYKDFKRAGTTAGLQHNHRDLASRQAEMVKLDGAETADLKAIFKEANRKRFFQQKHGGEICYAVVWFKGNKYNYIIEGGNDFARMVNLNTMRKWTLEEPMKIEALYALIKKNRP